MSTGQTNYTGQPDESGLSDRGIGVQAAGFAFLGSASLAIIQLFSDSDYWLYQWFEMAGNATVLGVCRAVGGSIRLGENHVRKRQGNP